MKKIFLFELPEKFCKWYHGVIVALHLLGGFAAVFISNIQQNDSVTEGILLSIFIIVAGTICFLILPIIFVAVATFTRFLPVIGIPVYLIACIGNLFGDNNPIGFEYFLLSIGLSAFGWFNIRTAVIANRDEDFNGIMIINS